MSVKHSMRAYDVILYYCLSSKIISDKPIKMHNTFFNETRSTRKVITIVQFSDA